jgi:hypothetical protein
MKRLLCLLLLLFLLPGCSSAPALREGYYLVPLEESNGSPMYFCLEPGGTGYVHAMGVDVELSWTSQSLAAPYDDCTPTAGGLTFPADGGFILCTYSNALPETHIQPLLQPGFYIPLDEELTSTLTYVQLLPDGTGIFSTMGTTKTFEWSDTRFYFEDMIVCATAEGFVARDTVSVNYIHVGDQLPEYYN